MCNSSKIGQWKSIGCGFYLSGIGYVYALLNQLISLHTCKAGNW